MSRISMMAGVVLLPAVVWGASFPIQWHPGYDVRVPYEVEIEPAKLEKLGGIDPKAGYTVSAVTAAGAQALAVATLPGRAPGSVRLRFRVPAGTTALTGSVGQGVRYDVASETVDNIFAGALKPESLAKWRHSKSTEVTSLANGGVALRGASGTLEYVRYSAPVPPECAGQPAMFEMDVTSRAKQTRGARIYLCQYDAAGKLLPEFVVDQRWTSHMRPPDVYIPYREGGRFHPRAVRVELVVETQLASAGYDEYGLRIKDQDMRVPKLDITHLALRPAARLPFPGLEPALFAKGVTGEATDGAFAFDGTRGFAFQTRSWASWSQNTQIRDERDCFFPSAAGTIEGYFNLRSLPTKGVWVHTFFQASHHQARIEKGSVYKENRGDIVAVYWMPTVKAWRLILKDANDKVFTKDAKGEPPVGRWFHLAAAWTPGGDAALFLDGKRMLTMPIPDFKPYDLVNTQFPNDSQCTEVFVGCNLYGTRWASGFKAKPQHPYLDGAGDLVRVSSGARYTADFTPAKRFALDADTRALFTFDGTQEGVSGGGFGWIPATVYAPEDRVSHQLDLGGKKVFYWAEKLLDENDPRKVLHCLNYPEMPTGEEYRQARVSRTASARLAPGAKFTVQAGKRVYPDFVEYVNDTDSVLVHPLLLGEGDLDPRSFGDIADTLGLDKLDDRARANAMFNFVLGASDYFMSHQSFCGDWTDKPQSVEYQALVMLNSYCGFECGPLNNLVANLFATSARLPASQTGGYGHSFEEVFYNGANHIYDVSFQTFYPAKDNETAASLAEDGDQPSIHFPINGSPILFYRNGLRGHWVQQPAVKPKMAMSLNPGERFKVWYANNGVVNDIQHNTCYCGNRRVDFHNSVRVKQGMKPYLPGFQHECSKESGLKPAEGCDVHVVDIFFPHYGNGFLAYEGKVDAANPAFTEVKADSFCYLVHSCYPVVAGTYAVTCKDGRQAPIEISTNRRDFDPVGSGKAEVGLRIRSRNLFLVRVKAAPADVASFSACTEVMVNPRILPGKVRAGANVFTLKSSGGKPALVKVGWREPAKEIVFGGTFKTGSIPGYERELAVLDPAGELRVPVKGASERATVRAHGGLEAKLVKGELVIRAGTAKDQSFGAVDVTDGDALKQLTVMVAAGARVLKPAEAKTVGGLPLRKQDAALVQDALFFTKTEHAADFQIDPLPAGDYVTLPLVRFPSHPQDLRQRVLCAEFDGFKETVGVASACNDAINFLEAHFGQPGGRANWRWDYPFEPLSEYPYHMMRYMPLGGTKKVRVKLAFNYPDGVEFGGILILKEPTREFKRNIMKVLGGLNCEPWRVSCK